MKIDDGDTLKQFIQPLTYRLSKTIELNQKWLVDKSSPDGWPTVRLSLSEIRVRVGYFDFLV